MKPQVMSCEIDFKLVSEFLFNAGCCKICVLRFLKPEIDDFLDVENSFESVNFHNIYLIISKVTLDCLQKNISICDENEPTAKRQKPNTCIACCGLFKFLDELIQKVKTNEALLHYEVKRFLTSYSLPVTLDLIQLQIWFALIEKFPNTFVAGEKVERISIDLICYV